MKQAIYTIYHPQIYKSKTILFDHYIYKKENKIIIAPIKFHCKEIYKKGLKYFIIIISLIVSLRGQ